MKIELDNNWKNILEYWFGDGNLDYDRWFYKSSKHDSYIRDNFSYILTEAERGHLLNWLDSKGSYIAYIILMSQLSRQIYRNTIDEFKNDKKVLLFAEMGYDMYIEQCNSIEKIFILKTYQNYENKDIQLLGIQLLEELINKETNISEKNILKTALYHHKEHYKIIKRFGRFPKRNYILNRLSTEDEIDYMDKNENSIY